MGFAKVASATTLAVATAELNKFQRTAAYADNDASAFLGGRRPIDIQASLDIVAEAYDISNNPSDYIFEAIRGNTVNVPNENSDGFHKNELTRFDHRLGKQVYRTYELKPHQIQHRAENPKTARGVVLDAFYNDLAPPDADCKNCGNKTASKDGRDPETGIHCVKCGHVVKDEFIELLIAIDKKKDPTFAQGVLSGVLKHGSMGCSCTRTRCNVCNKVAYTVSEFCKHIRNKGKVYDESEEGFNPVAFTLKFNGERSAAKVKKEAKAFEWCEGVVFDEYSRVHDPADPKAEQYEIISINNRIAQLQSDQKLALEHESEILTLKAKMADLERKINKAAQKTSDVVINIGKGNGGPEDVEVQSGDPMQSEDATSIETLTPEDLGLTPAPEGGQASPADVGILPGAEPPPKGPAAPLPPPPRQGGKTEGKALQRLFDDFGEPSMLKFAESYKNLKAEVTASGNVRVFDDEGTYFAIKPSTQTGPDGKQASVKAEDLAKDVLKMIAEQGLASVVKNTKAMVGPRLAQVLNSAMDDMMDKRESSPNSVLDRQESDKAQAPASGKQLDTATGTGEAADKKETHDTKTLNDDVLKGWEPDLEDEKHPQDPHSLKVTEHQDSDARQKRAPSDLGKSVLDNETHDHKERMAANQNTQPAPAQDNDAARKHAARLEVLYKDRLEKKVAEMQKQKDEFERTFNERFMRALKLAAKRQALNLEYCALKESLGEVLCSPRPLNDGYEYNPMDMQTAVHLVEAAFNEPNVDNKPGFEAFVNSLVDRAASIMKLSDENLLQAETDIANLRPAPIYVEASERTNSFANDNMRHAAVQGNLQLAPAGGESQPIQGSGTDRRDQIRQAVSNTKVSKVAGLVNR